MQLLIGFAKYGLNGTCKVQNIASSKQSTIFRKKMVLNQSMLQFVNNLESYFMMHVMIPCFLTIIKRYFKLKFSCLNKTLIDALLLLAYTPFMTLLFTVFETNAS